MKVLIVCSGNAQNFSFEINQAFIYDQVSALTRVDSSIEFDYFFIKGHGPKGYLKNLGLLKRKIFASGCEFIHAHNGESVLLATLQNIVPVIGTFHGSDLNNAKNRLLSNFAHLITARSVVVSSDLKRKLYLLRNKAIIIPCGVDFELFFPIAKNIARESISIEPFKKVILFASAFSNPVKNYALAQKAIQGLNRDDLLVLELKGYSRQEINLLMNSADLALMTSLSEGSPQFIKEAMACNLPIVSTDIGDVRHTVGDTEGCFITDFSADNVTKAISAALNYGLATNGRSNVGYLENKIIAKRIYDLYKSVSKNQK